MVSFNGFRWVAEDLITSVPEFAQYLKALKDNQEHFADVINFVCFVYDKKSPYKEVIIADREKLVFDDLKLNIKYSSLKTFKGIPADYKNMIKKYKQLNYTHKERLVDAWNEKVNEYVNFWKTITFDESNSLDQGKVLKNINDLLEMKDKIDALRDDKETLEAYGGGQSTLFENP